MKMLDLNVGGDGLMTAKFSVVEVKKYDAANTVLSTTNASGRVVFRQ